MAVMQNAIGKVEVGVDRNNGDGYEDRNRHPSL